MPPFQQSDLLGDTAWLWLAKAAGAVAGSAVSLAYVLPRGRREAAIRFAVGIICGLVFGGAAGVKLGEYLAIGGMLGTGELMLMGSAAASLAAWSALGIFTRFAERAHDPEKLQTFRTRSCGKEERKAHNDRDSA